MSVVGSVSVRVVPSFSGMQRTISRQFTGAGQQAGQQLSRSMAASMDMRAIGGAIQGVGDRMSALGGTLTKNITLPAAGAAAAVGGIVGAFGWGRLQSVDSAQAQLRGLGYSAEDVERISGQLTDALEGGMLTMGEATSAAAAGMAAGVEEGAELTRYIQLLDAATAGSNGTFDEMNQIFARIQGSGRLMTNELDMIEQRMPGFSGAAAEHYGISQEALREMVSAGEVSADEFLDIMDSFAGDMATEYAKSWEGMVQNTKAYIGILGENLLGGVFEQSKEAIAEFIEFLSSDEVEKWATSAGESIGNAFSSILDWVRGAIDWWIELDTEQKKWIGTIAAAVAAAGPFLVIAGKILGVIGGLISTVGVVAGWFSALSTAITNAYGALTPLARVLSIAGRVFGFLANPIAWVVGGLIAVWAASEDFRESVANLARAIWDSLVDAFTRIWEQLGSLWDSFTDLWGSLSEGGGVLDTLGTTLSWVIDLFAWLLPILIDVASYIVTGLIVALEWLVDGFAWIVDKVSGPLGEAMEWLSEVAFPAVGDAAMWLWENAIQPAWEGITAVVSAFAEWWTETAWPAIRETWDAFADFAVALYEDYIEPSFTKIRESFGRVRDTFSDIWENHLSGVFAGIWDAVIDIRDTFRDLWDNHLAPIWDSFKETVTDFWNEHQETFLKIAGALAALGAMPVLLAIGGVITIILTLGALLWVLADIAETVSMLIAGDFEALEEKMAERQVNIGLTLLRMRADFRQTRQTAFIEFGSIALRFSLMASSMWDTLTTRIASVWENKDAIVRNSRRVFFSEIGRMINEWDWFGRALWITIRTLISNAWSNFSERILGVRDYFRDRVSDMGGYWSDFGRNLYDTVNNSIRTTLSIFGITLMADLRRRIDSALTGIGILWESLKRKFAEPIDWVIRQVVNNGLIESFNKVAGFIPGVSEINHVRTIYERVGAYAKGGVPSEEWYIAGEEGPELIHRGRESHRVYTAEETRERLGGNYGIGDGELTWRERALARLAPGAYRVGRAAEEVGDWVRGGLKSAVESLLDPIFKRANDYASGRGIVAQYGVGMAEKVKDEILDWAGKDDDDFAASMAGGFYDGPFTANPGGFNRPMQGPITSRAGRRSYWGAFGNMHYGVDIGAPIGSAVRAAWDGVVRSTGGGGLDRIIVLNHGGYDSAYMHNSQILASAGQKVSGGDIIARSGTAGSGPHLHFEMHPGGYYNPSVAGVNALFRDKGGLLYPGLNQVMNQTGQAEYVFNRQQFDNLNRMAESSSGTVGGDTYHVHGDLDQAYRLGQEIRFVKRSSAKRRVGV